MTSELTPKQEKFCQKYIETGNASGKYYVYQLVDPFSDEVFYVGKGTGDRAWRHERDARHLRGLNPCKELRIAMILKRGGKPEIRIVYSTDSESEAYEVERINIQKIGYHQLTNQAKSARSAAVNAYLHGRAFVDCLERKLANGLLSMQKIEIAEHLIEEMKENMALASKIAGSRAIDLALAKSLV